MSREVMKLALEHAKRDERHMNHAETRYWCRMYRDIAEKAIEALAEQPAQQEPEFFTHSVERPYDWSEWVCPDPKSYLMKCCDCGLVHEAQFGVVLYKSETEREDCDMVDDPNLQAVFRMRRSEQWSPEDTAHRAGGLPMSEQPAQQEPVSFLDWYEHAHWGNEDFKAGCRRAWNAALAQRTWVGLTDEEIAATYLANTDKPLKPDWLYARAIEAKLREKNT